MKKVWLLIATFFNVGYFPIAPGTLTSLITTAVFYLANVYLNPSLYVQVASTVLLFLVGLPAASAAEQHFKRKDPAQVVIDEVVGQMVSLLLVPVTIPLYLAAFFLFRFFDIIKPVPVRKADQLSGGFGIMLDDIAAALYTLGVLHLLIFIF